jgi:hypothetical protein
VAVIGPGRREFAELVADHVFRHQHRNVLVAVVDAERQADELRQMVERRLQVLMALVAAALANLLSLLEKIAVNKRAFPVNEPFDLTSYYFLRWWRERMMNLSVDLFERVRLPLVGLPHGVTG